MIHPMSRQDDITIRSGLQKLNTYYEVGDYRQARRLARELLANHSPDEGDKERIDHVLIATRIDPVALGAIVFTIALLLHLFVVYAV
jgi:hypothetical protein